MKYILPFAMILVMTGSAFAQQSPAEEIADKIAKKMKDSLQLTTAVQSQLYNVNLQLHGQKMAVRQQYAASSDTLTMMIQRVENTRDSLYRAVLQDEDKYLLYKQKKRNLISNQ